MVGIGVVLLVAILVFILQNGQRVRVRFLMVDGTLQPGWRCCSPPCSAPCWCWWQARRGCCNCAWSHDAIAAPTKRPKRQLLDTLAMSTESHALGTLLVGPSLPDLLDTG
jgi:hypothetical protein